MSQSEGASFIPCCPEESMASLCSPVHLCTVTYPPNRRSDTAKKQFKHKLLKEKPETLFADQYKTSEEQMTSVLSKKRVAISLRAVIEKASDTFPNSNIISTLLPHKDFHLYTIRKTNASISREYAPKPKHPPPDSGHSLPL
ncbi:hypothetical protein AOLI_G00030860 [Acnodon oligacanthus]